MISNKLRRLCNDPRLLDRPYMQAVHPCSLDSDLIHNNVVCSLDELYGQMMDHQTVREFGNALLPSYSSTLALEFSRIAENYRDALQKLHDTTLQALKDACLAVAKEIDEEAKSRFALGDDCPHAKAAENATRRHVFGYNEKARLKRDYELREDFRLRASTAKIAEVEPLTTVDPIDEPVPTNSAPESPPTDRPVPRLRTPTEKSVYLGCSVRRKPNPIVAGPVVVAVPEAPPVPAAAPTTDSFLDELAPQQEAEALKAKVVLSEPEQLHIPDFNTVYNWCIRKSTDPEQLIDYCSRYDCHSIKRTGVEGNYTYTKTTTINTDSIHMSHP